MKRSSQENEKQSNSQVVTSTKTRPAETELQQFRKLLDRFFADLGI